MSACVSDSRIVRCQAWFRWVGWACQPFLSWMTLGETRQSLGGGLSGDSEMDKGGGDAGG